MPRAKKTSVNIENTEVAKKIKAVKTTKTTKAAKKIEQKEKKNKLTELDEQVTDIILKIMHMKNIRGSEEDIKLRKQLREIKAQQKELEGKTSYIDAIAIDIALEKNKNKAKAKKQKDKITSIKFA